MNKKLKSSINLVTVMFLILSIMTGCSSKDSSIAGTATVQIETIAPTATIQVPSAPAVTASSVPQALLTDVPVSSTSAAMSDTQKNSVAMLNYLGTLMQQIHASKGSRLYLESVYDEIINNINPNAVDETTHEHFTDIFGQLKRFMMVAIKRDRLMYIYEQNKAQALRQAIPNPIGLLSAANSKSIASLVSSVVYMAVDAITSYDSAMAQNEIQYLQDSWELDDEELEVILSSREDAFSYLLDIVNEYKLPNGITLNASSVQSFVEQKNNSNVIARVQYLEDHQSTYKAYGGYWLTLAESYYTLAEQGHSERFADCIHAINEYQNLHIDIFRRDIDFSRVLPLAVVASEYVFSGDEYIRKVTEYADLMLKNCAESDWSVPYFAAQTYVMLAGKTGDRRYLDEAYKIARSNVTMLYQKQLDMNADYLAPVASLYRTDPKGATEEQKKDVKEYNSILDSNRKTELPPLYEPLQISCALLFSLAKEIGVDENEKAWVDGILHKDGKALFLINPIDNAYYFSPESNFSSNDVALQFSDGKKLVIPVAFVCANSKILVTVESESGTMSFDDWYLTEVIRHTEGDLSTFFATYKSQSIDKFTYHAGDVITITVTPIDGAEVEPYSIKFNVVDNGVTVPLINLDASWIPHGLTFERVAE